MVVVVVSGMMIRLIFPMMVNFGAQRKRVLGAAAATENDVAE